MSDIVVNAGGNLQTAINSANPGDTISLEAGATWDGVFTLPDLGASAASPITIRSQNHALLPVGRVSPANAVNMPRVRTTGTAAAGAFTTATGANGWALDGLELTDNAGTGHVNNLVDWSFGNDDMSMTRCYLHQKETGTDYQRSVAIAMQFEGTGLLYKWNYVEDFIGSTYDDPAPMNTECLQCIGGPGDILMEDNYLSAWYNAIFLGGGDTPPTHTATLTSASTTSATFSSVAGLEVGAFVRFSVVGTATLSNQGSSPTLTRLTGAPWVTAEGNNNGNWGDSCLITSVASPSNFGITRLMTLTGDNVFTTMAANSSVIAIPNGAVTYEIYQTAKVTNIAGSVVTYDPLGTTAGIDYSINKLVATPVSAAWCQGDEGRVVDVTVIRNTFYVNPVYAAYLRALGRSCPKGTFEIKSVDRFLFEGNYVLGYPAAIGFTAANQNGSAPWITVDNLILRSNWIAPDTGQPDCTRSAFLIADDAYLNVITPTTNVTITNNLIIDGIRSFLEMKNGDVWELTHNTCLNAESSTPGPNALLSVQDLSAIPAMNFSNNIGYVVCSGLRGYPTNFDSPTVLNNVLIDANIGCSGGINVNTFGVGSGLPPVPTDPAQVGFTNLVGDVYLLAPDSAYKGEATDGSDPGVNWTILMTALGATSSGSTTLSGVVGVVGKVVLT